MRIVHLLNMSVPLSNEEDLFVNEHADEFSIESLIGRDEILARNLVRKGIYEISKDSKRLVKINEKTSK